jgi:hypothetical protein
MKKIILIYGLIAGVIVAGMMLITMPMYESGTLNFDNGEVVGYTTMVIALSMIFFGVKSFRDNHQHGVITFGQGFKIGILITAIASVMYALAWEISFNTMATDFTQKMIEHYFSEMKENGASEAELAAAKVKWDAFGEYYKNPIIRFGMTLMEILPVGLVITLISAGLLRKKEFLSIKQTA